MGTGLTPHRNPFDFVEDLAYDLNDKNVNNLDPKISTPVCPHLAVTVMGNCFQALIDTGSQVTAISEELFNQLEAKNKLYTLPVSNVIVIPAIGKKATTVKKQVLLEMVIDNQKLDYPCLVIPHLANQIILGNDWLLRNNVIINYNNRSIEVNCIRVCKSKVSFEWETLNKLVSSTSNNVMVIQIINTKVSDLFSEKDIIEKLNETSNLNNLEICNRNSEDQMMNSEVTNNNDVLCENITAEIVSDDQVALEIENIELEKNYPDDLNTREIPEIVTEESVNFEERVQTDFSELVVDLSKVNNIIQTQELSSNEVNSRSEEITGTENQGEDHNFFKELPSVAANLTALDDAQAQLMLALLIKYKTLFSNKPGCADVYEHKIRLTKQNPHIRKSYPVPIALKEDVDKEIEYMLDLGIIERSISPYCNPLRIVKKKKKQIRVCLDARFLNDVVEGDNESPPNIPDLLQKHYGVKYMSTIDLTHGYWQISLSPESRPLTAFLHGSSLYQFCRVPFGLKTAGSAFIRALNLALGNEYSSFLTCYVDDLLITSPDFETHLLHLELVFKRLLEHNFTLRLEKSKFCRESVIFLGFLLTPQGITPDPEKLAIIRNFQEPENQLDLQRILGICNFYRQFSIQHSQYLDPFRELLKKDAVWNWTEDHSKAYKLLKENFMKSVTLSHIIPNCPFKIQTDASNKGICGILYQTDDKGDNYLISIVSRCLTAPEMNYTTTEKELLAIMYAVQKFRMFIAETQFKIITDHKSLTFLKNSTFHNGRLIRWCLLLNEYSFNVEYCRGTDNKVADFFSRNPEGKFEIASEQKPLIISKIESFIKVSDDTNYSQIGNLILSLVMDKDLKDQFKKLVELQQNDEIIMKQKEQLVNNDDGNLYFQIYNDILFHQDQTTKLWQIVVPICLKESLVKFVHSKLGHPGQYKTLQYLKTNYYWKGMARDVKKFVTNCDLCQRVKYLSINMEGEYDMVKADEPGELVTVDFYGPLPKSVGGVQHIFVMIDAFSKYVSLYPMKKATTRVSLKKILDCYIPKLGKPKKILSDHGTQFTAHAWKNTLEKEDIKVCYSSIRHPQSNPTERVMRELGRFFRTFCSDQHTKWAKFIPEIENLLNITTHFSTGYTPHELHFGEMPMDQIRKMIKYPDAVLIDHQTKILLARENLKRNFEKRKNNQKIKRVVELKVNDLVLLKVPIPSNAQDKVTHKFFHIYQGPYQIIKIIGRNAFVLSDPQNLENIKGTYNRTNLRKYQHT